MNRAAQVAVCFFMLTAAGRGQQVASVDLSRVSVPTTSPRKQAKPNDCEDLPPRVIADGFAKPVDQEPREIVVEMVRISDSAPRMGSVVQGEVRLRNSSKHPIQIPWSVDPTVRGKDQYDTDSKTGATFVQWEEGEFDVYLQGSALLKNLSQPLFSSKSAPRSQITIGPNEWATVKLKFKIESGYPYPPLNAIKKGASQLTVDWDQTAISGTMYQNGCLVGSFFSHYDHYYKQQHPALSIAVH